MAQAPTVTESAPQPVQPAIAEPTCFRVGTVQDLLEGLRFAHEHGIPLPERRWGLKLLGYAVCARVLHDPAYQRILEAGVGFGDEMHRAFGGTPEWAGSRELWTIDNEAFYTPEQVAQGRENRKPCTNLDGLLGEFHPDLPEGFFDAVFSISALEHAPMDTVRSICEDMFRVTKPGGLSAHTLDFGFDLVPQQIEPWLVELRRAGFEIDDEGVDLTEGLTNRAGSAHLFEPVEQVFKKWCGRSIDDAKPLPHFGTAHAAVVVVARKPG